MFYWKNLFYYLKNENALYICGLFMILPLQTTRVSYWAVQKCPYNVPPRQRIWCAFARRTWTWKHHSFPFPYASAALSSSRGDSMNPRPHASSNIQWINRKDMNVRTEDGISLCQRALQIVTELCLAGHVDREKCADIFPLESNIPGKGNAGKFNSNYVLLFTHKHIFRELWLAS